MKKKFLKWGALVIGMSMLCALAFSGCGETPKNPGGENPGIQKPGGNNNNKEEEFKVTYRSGYTPEKIGDVKSEFEELAPGVYLVKNTMTILTGGANVKGKTSVVYTVEVDLKKADVNAGTKDNKTVGFNWEKTTPYKMGQAWEEATGGKVYASINADFFGTYSVNAFVKDGIIIKDGHNDNGYYDYKQTGVPDGSPNADVPASAPMLFGIKGTTAQIAPIKAVTGDPTTAAVKQQFVQSKLFYALNDGLGNVLSVKENIPIATGLGVKEIAFRTSTTPIEQKAGGYAVKVDTTGGITNLKVEEVHYLEKRTEIVADESHAWLQTTAEFSVASNYLKSLKPGDTISFAVASEDGTWNGYDTILGCRQALVTNNAIPATVAKENTNGAQTQDIPRTAVGVKNGRVVLIAVESLYYYINSTVINKNGYKANPETDFHGMNLPELAEFAYYYGCSDAANFDGGGSTQLVVRGVNDTEARTVVRAAEFFTTGLNDTRAVVNAFLITSRVDK